MKKLLQLWLLALLAIVGTTSAAAEVFTPTTSIADYVSPAPHKGQFVNGTKWFQMQFNKNNAYISTKATTGLNDTGFTCTLTDTQEKTDATSLWCIVGDATTGYRFFNKDKGTGYVFGFDEVATEHGQRVLKMQNAEQESTSKVLTYFSVTYDSEQTAGYCWAIKPSGVTFNMGLNPWNSSTSHGENENYISHWGNGTGDGKIYFTYCSVETDGIDVIPVTYTYEYKFGEDVVASQEITGYVGDEFENITAPAGGNDYYYKLVEGSAKPTGTITAEDAKTFTYELTQVYYIDEFASPAPVNGEFQSGTKWYSMYLTNESKYVSMEDYDATGFKCTQTTVTSDDPNDLWCLVGNHTDGFLIYNKAKGGYYSFGFERQAVPDDTQTGAPEKRGNGQLYVKMLTTNPIADDAKQLFSFAYNSKSGDNFVWVATAKDTASPIMGINLWNGEYLRNGEWSGPSRVMFTFVASEDDLDLVAAEAAYNLANTYPNCVGSYAASTETLTTLKNAIAAVKAEGGNTTANVEAMNSAVAALGDILTFDASKVYAVRNRATNTHYLYTVADYDYLCVNGNNAKINGTGETKDPDVTFDGSAPFQFAVVPATVGETSGYFLYSVGAGGLVTQQGTDTSIGTTPWTVTYSSKQLSDMLLAFTPTEDVYFAICSAARYSGLSGYSFLHDANQASCVTGAINWASSETKSQWCFELVDAETVADLENKVKAQLYKTLEATCTVEESLVKDEVGYCTEAALNILPSATFSDYASYFTFESEYASKLAECVHFPQAGHFYRLFNKSTSSYLGNAAAGSQIALSTDATASTIYYLTSDGKLVNVEKSLAMNNVREMATVAANATAYGWRFESDQVPYLRCISTSGSADTWLDRNSGGTYADRYTANGNDRGDNIRWQFTEVKELPVTITSAGYGTIYAPVALEIPEGVTAYYAKKTSPTTVTLTEVADVIPAETPVVIAGEGNHEFAVSAEAGTAVTGNLLKGQVLRFAATEGLYMTLQKPDKAEIGFYSFSGSEMPGFKAYLLTEDVPDEVAVRGFAFGDALVTAIQSAVQTQSNANVYDLQGRRIQQPTRGFYIQGGKKYVK